MLSSASAGEAALQAPTSAAMPQVISVHIWFLPVLKADLGLLGGELPWRLARNIPFVPEVGVPSRYFRISCAFPSFYTWIVSVLEGWSHSQDSPHWLVEANLCQ